MTDVKFQLERVLIVDDDPILSAIVESFFRKRDARDIRCAANGRAALDIVDEVDGQIDFILCDLNMPELDGLQFMRHLKNRQFTGQIAILSGEQDSVVRTAEKLAKAHSLNVVGSLGKPLKLNILEDLVSRLSPHEVTIAKASPTLATAHDLKNALIGGDIVPFYQPKIDVEKRTVSGAEALARWLHPKLGVIGPNFFLPMAEDNGLMTMLTERMISCAIANMLNWQERRIAPKVSINLSAETVNNIDFPDEIAELFDGVGLDRGKMVFEVTERQLVARNTHASEVLARLRIMGFGISIDDFGTGYSNIEQLREFPFTELKIDQSFIREAAEDRFAQASVEASINLGRQLQLRLVAEGVETEEQLNYVRASGIDEVQGFIFARPMPADDFLDWVLNYEGRHMLHRNPSRVAASGGLNS